MSEINRNEDMRKKKVRKEGEVSAKKNVRREGSAEGRKHVKRTSEGEFERRPVRREAPTERPDKKRPVDKTSAEAREMRRRRNAELLAEDNGEKIERRKTQKPREQKKNVKEGMETEMGRRKKYKMFTIPDMILLGIQAVLSVMAMYFLKKLLPFKYWIVLLMVLVIAFVLILFGMKISKKEFNKRKNGKNKKNGKRIAARIVSVILSIAMLLGCMAANKGFSALDDITEGKYQTRVISMVVLTDSSYNELEDLEGKKVGITAGLDTENVTKALEEIKDKRNVNVENVESANILDMASALKNGEVDAVLFSEAYRGIIEDSDEAFSNDTRIIYQYEIKEELQIAEVDKEVAKEPFSVYISGIDTYGPVSTVSRSDVNMIVTVNPETKKILMTSIPRDYYVPLASFGVKDKLTHAGIYGVEESMGTLENLFGIEIDYYARVNFTSLVNMVDALGGITVNNPQEFTSYHTHDYYPAGQINMDGETALEFVRERYGLPGGDNDRVKNQQRVLAAMLEKAMSPAIIKNYSSILDAVSGSFVTNMSSGDIQKLIQMQLDDMASWDIEQIAVTGTGTKSTTCYSAPGSNLYVMEPNYDSVKEASATIDAVRNVTE